MEEEILISIDQKNCSHWEHRKHTERNFDVLYGFEIVISARATEVRRAIDTKKTDLGI
jgi:hypothetical protein